MAPKWHFRLRITIFAKFISLETSFYIERIKKQIDDNILKKVGDMDKLIEIRCLTLLGTITIIKSLLIPSIVHAVLAMPFKKHVSNFRLNVYRFLLE